MLSTFLSLLACVACFSYTVGYVHQNLISRVQQGLRYRASVLEIVQPSACCQSFECRRKSHHRLYSRTSESDTGRNGVVQWTTGSWHNFLRGFDNAKATVRDRFKQAKVNFKDNPWQYLTIPIVAAFVGYITNYLGVSMLFYPVQWRGIPIHRWPEQPFGLFGWQGVVPAKRFRMASTMVDVTISRLLKISEVFSILEPAQLAAILSPAVREVVFGGALPMGAVRFFLRRVSRDMIKNIESVLDVKALVVEGMTSDPKVLGSFFQRVGAKELSFLVESGTYFGFLLGLLQMLQWILFPKNWTLPVGGAVVGYITNWIALKWIFEPLNPTRVGPFVLQGLFLRRQKEVSAEFSSYISENVLNSQQVWTSLLSDKGKDGFMGIIGRNVPFLSKKAQLDVVKTLRSQLTGLSDIHTSAKDVTMSAAATAAAAASGDHALHGYINRRLDLANLLTERMNRLSPAEFEQVLHPVFQEDELTLIIAGGVLGLLAGLSQWWLNVYLERRQRRGNSSGNSQVNLS